jgi:hypothetical protein
MSFDIDDNRFYNDSLLNGKLHETLEDPISQLFYDTSSMISPFLYQNGVTPNMVTIFRLVMIIISFFYFFEHKYYRTTAIIFVFAYFLDCLDGHMARKFNMVTKFGDYLDHCSDIITFVLAIFYICKSINEKYNYVFIIIIIILFLSILHISCEERYIDLIDLKRVSPSLDATKCICSKHIIDDDNLEYMMDYTKVFGLGTSVILIAIVIWNFKFFEN